MQATPARKDVDNNNSNDHNNYDNNGNSTENATKKETHTIPQSVIIRSAPPN